MTLAASGGGGASGFVLQIVALITGGGIVQMIMFLIRRKSEFAALDRTSAKPLLEEQGAFIDRLAAAETKALARVAELEKRIEAVTEDFTRRLTDSATERLRGHEELATVRYELDSAKAQIAELRRRQAAWAAQGGPPGEAAL